MLHSTQDELALSSIQGFNVAGERKLSREEQLVAEATQVFSKGGFRDTSLQEVADKLNITRPLFYYYFESKDDLLWRIIGRLGDELLEGARPICESALGPTEKIRQLLERHARTLLENVDAFRIYFAERDQLEGRRHRRLRRGEIEYQELLISVVTDGQAAGEFKRVDPWLAERLVFGMANSMVRWYEPSGGISQDVVIRDFTQAGLDVLRAS
jgi:TetR/AcrR family transcriptional regulator, cholesterol catabolism regulator